MDVPLRKRVAGLLREKINKRTFARFGKKAAKFVNKQFALIIIGFFVFSLNVVSAPLTTEATLNPLIDYNPIAVASAARDIQPYLPIINDLSPASIEDQVLSALVGPETAYIPKPMLTETITHELADRIRRGVRREIVTHTIKQGETLSQIAAQYGLNVATILEDNNLSPQDTLKIKPGMELAIAPEKKTDSLAWLESLHEADRKEREQQERERQSRLAQARSTITRSRASIAQASASEPSDDKAGSGRFRKPLGAGCYNGYHWWALDCPTDIGTPIRSAASGVVMRADTSGYNGGYGMVVEVSHGNGWRTVYAHLSSISVSPGDSVAAGEVIAGTGNSGRSTGPHLHFEIQKDGRRFNPGNYVGF